MPTSTDPLSDERPQVRKRPLQARAWATVDAIVEATARILEEGGHGHFTTNAVAERAGVSIGTLYQYFPSKGALVGTLIERETARLLAEAELALDCADGAAALDRVIGAAVDHQLRRPALARLLDFEEGRLPLDPGTVRARRRFETVLTEVLTRPELRVRHDLAATSADVAAIIRGLVDAAGERGEVGSETLMERVRRAVLGYLER